MILISKIEPFAEIVKINYDHNKYYSSQISGLINYFWLKLKNKIYKIIEAEAIVIVKDYELDSSKESVT